jgi:hypothetical protein
MEGEIIRSIDEFEDLVDSARFDALVIEFELGATAQTPGGEKVGLRPIRMSSSRVLHASRHWSSAKM